MRIQESLKKSAVSILLVFSSITIAQVEEYEKIYPFTPPSTQEITDRVKTLVEDEQALINIYHIEDKGLSSFQLKSVGKQPWASTYWPLNKGTIADPYSGKKFNVFKTRSELDWKFNYNKFTKRRVDFHPKVFNGELTEEELSELAPSEKYDLLLGDTTFDLTNKLWDYAAAYGEEKYQAFVSRFYWDMAGISWFDVDNYVFQNTNSRMALWEGICHGWATASGNYPRPQKFVDIELQGNNKGKKLRIYPEDLKGLASLMWANSVVQDKSMTEGLRCNEAFPKRDKYGRYFDSKPDRFSKKYEPRCVGVHPAILHMSLANIIGKQNRSFIVERKIKHPIDNHPMAGYEFSYFNPMTGEDGTLLDSIVNRSSFGDDPFRDYRNKASRKILGIKLRIDYIDWMRPRRELFDSADLDKIASKHMMYDLELDKEGNIVGGQWRVTKDGKPTFGSASILKDNNQPNFIWVIPKNWKDDFANDTNLEPWQDTSTIPPASWKEAAINRAHTFIYKEWALSPSGDVWKYCPMVNEVTGETVDVPCERAYNRPQPLYNIVNTLFELSK